MNERITLFVAKARANGQEYRLFTFIRRKVMVLLKRAAIFQIRFLRFSSMFYGCR